MQLNKARGLIRTGEAQTQGFDAAKFKTEVCKYLTAPLSCGGLKLDVRTFSSFGSSDLTNPLDSSGNLKSGFSYAPGVGGDVVVVRAFYEWDLLAAACRRRFDLVSATCRTEIGCSSQPSPSGTNPLNFK